jgi:hypothetical protein
VHTVFPLQLGQLGQTGGTILDFGTKLLALKFAVEGDFATVFQKASHW